MTTELASAVPLPPEGDGVDEARVDETFASAYRVQLDAHSWVEQVPGWFTGAGALFDELLRTARWEQRHRRMYGRWVLEPRLTAEHRDLSAAPLALRTMRGR